MSYQAPPGGQQAPPGFYPPLGYGPPQPPRRKRHILRNVLLSIIGVIVLIIVISVAANSGKGGGAPAATSGTSGTSSPPSPAASPKAVAGPAKRTLIRFSGSGIKNSAPFDVGSGPLTVRYSFNCASQGGSGNFIADLEWGNQSSFNSDDQQIANDLAVRGGQTTTIYPEDPGKSYYLAVNSECNWRIKVTG